MSYLTQEQKILAYLQKGHTLTPLEALNKYGCMRLAARINALRVMGHVIETQTIIKNGKRFAQYRFLH